MKAITVNFVQNQAVLETHVIHLTEASYELIKAEILPIINQSSSILGFLKKLNNAKNIIQISSAFRLKKQLHTLLSATGQIKDQNDLASLQHFVLILGKVFDRLVNQYHEPNLYIGAYVLSVTTLPVLNLALDTLEVDTDSLGALHA
ncbi:hypothetical protein ACT4XR_20415 (plasmid) [Acinetobacter baumannii]|uniref:hypothetical protein n=1 Tax=Acinetobacter baumannii TaxID=470 RepID=UPI003891681C